MFVEKAQDLLWVGSLVAAYAFVVNALVVLGTLLWGWV